MPRSRPPASSRRVDLDRLRCRQVQRAPQGRDRRLRKGRDRSARLRVGRGDSHLIAHDAQRGLQFIATIQVQVRTRCSCVGARHGAGRRRGRRLRRRPTRVGVRVELNQPRLKAAAHRLQAATAAPCPALRLLGNRREKVGQRVHDLRPNSGGLRSLRRGDRRCRGRKTPNLGNGRPGRSKVSDGIGRGSARRRLSGCLRLVDVGGARLLCGDICAIDRTPTCILKSSRLCAVRTRLALLRRQRTLRCCGLFCRRQRRTRLCRLSQHAPLWQPVSVVADVWAKLSEQARLQAERHAHPRQRRAFRSFVNSPPRSPMNRTRRAQPKGWPESKPQVPARPAVDAPMSDREADPTTSRRPASPA
jgi:hypothetical protein